ncbi:MAG: hypothetical protein MZV70_21910 [Desulfobacterales bacterium]|nr:hypothetical protein [Desulfobacterales bacterium]
MDQLTRGHGVRGTSAKPTSRSRSGRFAVSSDGTGGGQAVHALGLMSPATVYQLMEKTLPAVQPGASDRDPDDGARHRSRSSPTPKPGVAEKPYQCANRSGSFEAIPSIFIGRVAPRSSTPSAFIAGSSPLPLHPHLEGQPLAALAPDARTSRHGCDALGFPLLAFCLLPLTAWGVCAWSPPILVVAGCAWFNPSGLERKSTGASRSRTSARQPRTALLRKRGARTTTPC